MNPRPLVESLNMLVYAYQAYMRRALPAAGIEWPVTHVRVLRTIALTPQCTAQSLAAYMRSDKAQITRVLNDLLGAALIVKHDNPEDGRSRLLELSADGQALILQTRALESALAQRLTDGLGIDDVGAFVRTVQRMTENLNASQEAP